MRLDQICEIQSGYTARERLSERVGGVPALQMGDLNEADDWQEVEPRTYDLAPLKERYFAGPGDVLFRSRGLLNTASVVPDDWPYLAAVLLPLLLLKPDASRIRPDYLAWAINHPTTQTMLDRRARGTSLRMIPKAVLAELEIQVPDLPTQDAILETSRLADRAKHLENKAAELRHSLTSMILADAAHRGVQQHTKGVHA
ncbi:MAG: restriction endonuclease subunit S [Henriciella sp.]